MKSIIKTLLLMSVAVGLAGMFASCKKESITEPRIKYIRVTTPESSDSLLVGASQGRLIAIVGENLQDVQEIWFNDQKATLTPTYITSTTILVNVPNVIPKVITNTIKLIFPGGKTLVHNFE